MCIGLISLLVFRMQPIPSFMQWSALITAYAAVYMDDTTYDAYLTRAATKTTCIIDASELEGQYNTIQYNTIQYNTT